MDLSMQNTMTAIRISAPGGPEVLEAVQRPIPAPKSHELLIRVIAAGVNRPDVAQRKGHYPPPKDASPDVPGLEVSGIVEAVGANVKLWEPGDKLCALVSGGGYSQYVCVPEEQCLVLPEGVSVVDAASLPETFFTVWNNIFDIGKYTRGEKVLIHGGSSGIGVTAIQMVKAMGGVAIVTAGTDEKCNACLSLGADLAINYREEDFLQKTLDFTEGKGVDVILDMVGGAYTEKNISLLAPFGRMVIINAMKGAIGSVDLIQVMRKRLTITGSTLRPQSIAYKGLIARALMAEIWPYFPEKIKPVVYATFPLEHAAQAHELMESSSHIGKILLTTAFASETK